jgi:hypothetical protein
MQYDDQWSRVSAVGVVIRFRDGRPSIVVRLPTGERIFLSKRVQVGSGAFSASYWLGDGAIFPGIKCLVREAVSWWKEKNCLYDMNIDLLFHVCTYFMFLGMSRNKSSR